jgi:UDP-N-acetyl-D-mannosaminuronate dehydrogenase
VRDPLDLLLPFLPDAGHGGLFGIQITLHAGEGINHDPHLLVAPHMRTWPGLPQMFSTPLTPETLRAQDAVVVVVDHTAVDYDLVVRESTLVIDTRGVYRAPRPTVVKA